MSQEITVARVYSLEGHDQLNQVLDILRDEENIMGATVIRGIAGYGRSREIHTSTLLNLSLELPLVIEFFDETGRVMRAIDTLKQRLQLKHIISWSAQSHL